MGKAVEDQEITEVPSSCNPYLELLATAPLPFLLLDVQAFSSVELDGSVPDFTSIFSEAVSHCAILEANRSALQFLEADSLSGLNARLGTLFPARSWAPVLEAFLGLDSRYVGQVSLSTSRGNQVHAHANVVYNRSVGFPHWLMTLSPVSPPKTTDQLGHVAWDRISQVAKIGTWFYDLVSGGYECSDQVRLIHELPNEELQRAVESYIPEENVTHRTPFDRELEIRTPSEKVKWVRIVGTPTAEGRGFEGVIQDITDRKAVEDNYLSEHRLLDRMSRLAKVGGWSFEVDTLTGVWTEEITRIQDLDPDCSATVALGVGFFDGEDREKIEEAVSNAIHSGIPYDLELQLTSALGVRKWVRTIGFPVFENGRVVRVEGAMQDITDRKRYETAIRKNRAQLREFVSQTAVAMCMFDLDMHYIAVSQRWVKEFGRGRENIIGLSHYDIYPDIPPNRAENHKRALAGEFLLRDEDHWVDSDGTEKWLRWAMHPWRDENDEIGGIIASTEDITELKKSELENRRLNASLEQQVADRTAQLEQARRDLQSILDGIPSMVGYWDRNQRNRFANHAYYDWFGVTPDEIRGNTLEQLLGPDLYRLNKKYIEGALQGETQVFERIIPFPDGSRYRHSITHYIPDLHGSDVRGFYVLAYDVTQVKIAESALRMANHELEAFSYAVAHDLRAPLRAMGGFSQALIEDFGKELNPDAITYLHQIIAASRKMAALIDGLLALSRSTQSQLHYRNVNLTEIAQSIRHQLVETDPDRVVEWQIEPNLTAFGDPSMLETVVRNLIENAWKYSSKAPQATIRFYDERVNSIKRFVVEDNGAGFDPAYAERLFQPFQRLHREDEFVGIGIGLATVHRIVHRHGGQITASARPGQGARFSFTLGARENSASESNRHA